MGGGRLLSYFKPRNLRQGLILIVFAALLPVAFVSILQGFSSFDNTRDLASNKLNATARAVAERSRTPFVIAQHLLSTAAANPYVRDMTPRCREALSATARNYRPIVNFVRSDATGLVRCSVLPYKPGASLASENWWRQGIIGGRMTISAPVMGSISQRKLLILMLPLTDENGAQYGAISSGIDIAYLTEITKAAPESKRGVIAIVTDEGSTVARSNQKLPFIPDTTIRPGNVGNIEGADGNTWIYATAPVYGHDLHVIYAEQKNSLLASAIAQNRTSVLLPFGAILLASLAIWLGTNRLVVRWLRDLGRVVSGFAKGDFSGDSERFKHAPAEIAELSAGLHLMAQNIDKQNRELKQALDANIDLTREVHHRVKNNLQIITSLLTLQASRVEELPAQQVLAQTRARISALALIHRLLYQQDPENESERGKVAIANLMNELCMQIRSANRDKPGVDLECHASAHSIAADQAVPLALFAVEALTNAYRHAFPDAGVGKITLKFEQKDDNGTLVITDNGTGFEADDDIGQMGLELMNAFASQLSGKVSIQSRINAGSLIMLTFPASNFLYG